MSLTMVRNTKTNEDNLHATGCQDLYKVSPANVLAVGYTSIEEAKTDWSADDNEDEGIDGWSWVVVMPCAKKVGA